MSRSTRRRVASYVAALLLGAAFVWWWAPDHAAPGRQAHTSSEAGAAVGSGAPGSGSPSESPPPVGERSAGAENAPPNSGAIPVPEGWLGPVMPQPTPPLDQLEKKFHRKDSPSSPPAIFATQPAVESALSTDGNTCFVRRSLYERLRPMILQDPMAMRPIYYATPWVSSWTLEPPWSDYLFHPCGFSSGEEAPFDSIDGISTGWFHTGIEALDYLFTVGVHEIYIERQRPLRDKPQVGYQRTWYVVLE